jgi:predicted 2-oxoglutarate/Fe(II)-dependent dioxygenase YbiX
MNLNDDYEGGDVVFGDQRFKEIKRISLKKGSLLAFPSNFLYPHMIEPITKGTRYSIVAWLS